MMLQVGIINDVPYWKCTRCGEMWALVEPESCHCEHPFRLGSVLAGLLKMCGVKPTKNCGCKRREEELNRMGKRFWEVVEKIYKQFIPRRLKLMRGKPYDRRKEK